MSLLVLLSLTTPSLAADFHIDRPEGVDPDTSRRPVEVSGEGFPHAGRHLRHANTPEQYLQRARQTIFDVCDYTSDAANADFEVRVIEPDGKLGRAFWADEADAEMTQLNGEECRITSRTTTAATSAGPTSSLWMPSTRCRRSIRTGR